MDTIVSRMAFVTSLGTVLENLVTNKGVEIVTLKKMAMDETEMAVVGMDTCVEMEEKVGWEVWWKRNTMCPWKVGNGTEI